MIRWQNIRNDQETREYFHERIGDLIPEPPSVAADPHTFAIHVSDLGILTRLHQDEPSAWQELLFMDYRAIDGKWHLLLPIDDPHPGAEAVHYIHTHARTPEDHALANALAQLSHRCHELYLTWTTDHGG